MIDSTDRKILDILQEDARTPNSEIARQVGMVPSAVCERIRKLRGKGIIQNYEARVDAARVGLPLLAFVFVRTEELAGAAEAGPELKKIPEILEVYNIAGEDCYLVKIRVRDTAELGRLIRETIGRIPSVRSTRTTIVLRLTKKPIDFHLSKKKNRTRP